MFDLYLLIFFSLYNNYIQANPEFEQNSEEEGHWENPQAFQELVSKKVLKSFKQIFNVP